MLDEWMQEPNREEWEHQGYMCQIVRHPQAGHLCGYVGIPEGHPWFKKDYSDIDADVHGGLTYAAYGHDESESDKGYYKQLTDSKGRKLWWIGFDCNHYGDMAPYGVSIFEGNYRNMFYVHGQTNRLAAQAQGAEEELASVGSRAD